MKCLILMLMLLVICPLAARAAGLKVEDPERHFSFVVPQGWVVDMPDEKAGEHFNGKFTMHPSNVAKGEFPSVVVMFEAGGFKQDPQAYMQEWKSQEFKPATGILLRDDIRYEPLTGRIVADQEIFRDGALYSHLREVIVSGANSKVFVMLADRTADFWTHVSVQESIVSSLNVEVNMPAAAAVAPISADPEYTPMTPRRGLSGGMIALLVVFAGVLMLLALGAVVVSVLVALMMRSSKGKQARSAARKVPAASGGMGVPAGALAAS